MAKIKLAKVMSENTEDLVMPKGNYLFTVDTFEDGKTKNNDKQFLRSVVKCAEEGDFFGKEVKLGFSIEDAPGMRNFCNFCRALNLPIDVDEVDTAQIVGKQLRVEVIVKKRPWTTKEGEKIEITSNEAAPRDAFSPADEAPPEASGSATTDASPAAPAPAETDDWD
jgi:hypothetical protein